MVRSHFPLPKRKIQEFCDHHHIKRLSLFGSILTEDFGQKSDVDFLVQFDKDTIPSLFEMARMEEELSGIVGRKADFRTAEDLSRYFRNQVVEEAFPIYERLL